MTVTITKEYIDKVMRAMEEQRSYYRTDSEHATALGITSTDYSKINRNGAQAFSAKKWMRIGQELGVKQGGEFKLVTVKSDTFSYIWTQLEMCQERAMSAVLCDIPDIGKSHTAKEYARTHAACAYIDCALSKSRMELMRVICSKFGIPSAGRFQMMLSRLVNHLKSTPNPLIILDEAGDLKHEAFLELKAIWNATEGYCGWYMMGADGLEDKINRSIENRKVGYAEIFSRFGGKYQRVAPDGGSERSEFLKRQAAQLADANGAKDVAMTVIKSRSSLRAVKQMLKKEHEMKFPKIDDNTNVVLK